MQTYVVQSGDSLYSIATGFGVTVDDILQGNELDGSHIYVGQRLTIPQPSIFPPPPLPLPPFPPGSNLEQRVNRLEREQFRMSQEINQLQQRVNRLDVRVRRLEGHGGIIFGAEG
ncbi:LysM peptidoglycan-binding domain-containing protein [Paenibacillus sp. N1-5-1-14]|uniref:LysM peptidoglycan-binding domain-containing protein n=1 Tax=Paenibacillus radicibacter TaxID=2972488 RepID=UPI002158A9D2|nr:LysM peptidoglycan-binding domain-containing protein [Paenibacillus radicibacter]MCR8642626.1 LysM peptidoglycan-binding domain-containing protein [Paenibacillus radicibacter]